MRESARRALILLGSRGDSGTIPRTPDDVGDGQKQSQGSKTEGRRAQCAESFHGCTVHA
jgi:hypothetical protein